MDPHEEQDLPIPSEIGRYKIEGLLKKGGMSLLYLGTHPDNTEPVLIKVLSPKFLPDPEIAKRFLQEAELIKKVNHPNIVKLYDSGTWEGGFYIAMEFVKGSTLRKILNHQPFSLKRALEILSQIAYALCHLHTHGIVHGDIKPENILISENGSVKLIDFGIAEQLHEKKDKQAPKRLAGTPIYMSPEQLANWGNASFQSDIYALGILAYELALGKITHGRVILSLAPKGLQKILHKALQPHVEDRYADIVDFIADLSNYIKNGAYKQDKQGSDYFLELYESLEQFQESIVTNTPPLWNNVEVGFIARSGVGLSTQYYELLSINDHQNALFITESTLNGVQGMLSLASMRMLFLTLFDLHKEKKPSEFIQTLFSRMQLDPITKEMRFCYLALDTKAHTLDFFHANFAILLKNEQIVPTTPVVDTLFHAHTTFSKNERLLLVGCSSINQELIQVLVEPVEQANTLSCQQLADTLLRRLHMKEFSSFEEESLFLASLKYV